MKKLKNVKKTYKVIAVIVMMIAIVVGCFNIKVSAQRIIDERNYISDVYNSADGISTESTELKEANKEEKVEETVTEVETTEARSESYTEGDTNNVESEESNVETTTEETHNSDQGVAIIPADEEVEEPQSTSQSMYINGSYYDVEARFNYPKLGISYPVLSEWSDSLLRISLCHYWGFGPNQTGNYCIVGHNYSNGSLFGKLSGADIGDTFTLTTMDGNSLTYTVYDIYVVEPTDLSCTSQRTNGNTEITLITCYNNGAQRLIIKARA